MIDPVVLFNRIIRKNTQFAISLILTLVVSLGASQVFSADSGQEKHYFDIGEISLGEALKSFAIQTDSEILFTTDIVKDKKTKGLKGEYTEQEALQELLIDTELKVKKNDEKVYLIQSFNQLGDAGVVDLSREGSRKGGAQGSVAKKPIKDRWIDGVREEVIVTAQKREQNLIDVPISIVALGAAEIEARGISNFEDLGMAVPGLTVQDNGGNARRVFMRGLGNSAGFTSSLIGLYIDDMSVSGNPAYTLDVRPYDMERVEVLRGPQGTLYGDGSVGGTIRFITKKPQLDGFSAKADISTSFTKGGEPGQKIQAAVNVPLINDELGLSIVGTFEDAGGWIDQPAQSIDDYNGQEVANVRVSGLWRAAEALDVSAMVIVHRNDTSANIGEDDNGDHLQVFDLTAPPSFEDEYELYNVTLTYDLGSFEVLSSTGYLDSFTETNGLGYDFLGTSILLDNSLVNTSIFSEELRISSSDENALHWSVGVFYKDRQVDQEVDIYFGAPGPLSTAFLFPSVDNQNSKSWAVFGDTSFSMTERLEVGVGLRYFEDDRDFSNGAASQEGKFDSTSPRIYVNFDLTEGIKTYASVAKGFRSGGFNSFDTPSFDPETVWSYELGTKMLLLDGRLEAELAVFYSDYEDFQILGLLPPPGPLFNITSNGGSAEIKGVDLSFTWQATDSLLFGFNGNYVDTEVVELSVTSSSHVLGDRLDYAPEYSMALSATQNFEWSGKPGSVRLDYNVQGGALFTSRDSAADFIGSSDVINMLNFNVEWEWSENISLGVFGKNLLDDRGFIDPLNVLDLASRPRPRTFGLQLGLDF